MLQKHLFLRISIVRVAVRDFFPAQSKSMQLKSHWTDYLKQLAKSYFLSTVCGKSNFQLLPKKHS